ncbi:MAG: cobalamin biosynthesis protein [Methanobrevibacter sp.]|nr:cobalamin biosynthesis protein [Methanobrevibacter sp.]
MRVAILSVSNNGKLLSKKLKSLLDNDPTVIKTDIFHKNVKENINLVFKEYDVIIGIMALGILVRSICKNIANKHSDPAVLALDDKGNHVISLLSGHIGGANSFTKKIAKLLSSKSVITTATDIHDKISIDTLANHFHWNIIDKKKVLVFNKALLEDAIIHLKSSSYLIKYIENFFLKITLEINNDKKHCYSINNINNYIKNNYNYILSIDETLNNKIIAKFQNIELELKPKRLVVGIGSRKNISEIEVLLAIDQAMENLGISLNRVDRIATAYIKKNETGIIKICETLEKPLIIVDKEEIEDFYQSDISKDCEKSSFVKERFGIDGVSEACAIIAAGEGSKLIHRKIAINGVTVAVAISR